MGYTVFINPRALSSVGPRVYKYRMRSDATAQGPRVYKYRISLDSTYNYYVAICTMQPENGLEHGSNTIYICTMQPENRLVCLVCVLIALCWQRKPKCYQNCIHAIHTHCSGYNSDIMRCGLIGFLNQNWREATQKGKVTEVSQDKQMVYMSITTVT